jgi:endonuclease/exonuclease/phosphatase family metal-dependent hydrolase
MRIATFNVENLFDRAKVFNDPDPEAHRAIIDAQAALNKLFELPVYDEAAKAQMLVEMQVLGVLNRNQSGPFAVIRRNRGQLVSFPRSGGPVIVAKGRGDWVGWCDLVRDAVDAEAMVNTARVIRDVAADVLVVVEAESRPVLRRFHHLLSAKLAVPEAYSHIMLIDGNDDRGIDVGLATRDGFPIGAALSHVDLLLPSGEPVFSRDCPQYQVTTPGGASLTVLPNHFKSKFGGNDQSSRNKRLAQSRAVAAIYAGLRAAGQDNVVVLGDLNDTPDSAELRPLLVDTDLRDISTHPAFTDFQFRAGNGQRGIGTFGLGNDDDKIDYILLSPALFDRVTSGGIFRKGAWPGSRPPRWDVYPELTAEHQAASDHHAVFADIDLG